MPKQEPVLSVHLSGPERVPLPFRDPLIGVIGQDHRDGTRDGNNGNHAFASEVNHLFATQSTNRGTRRGRGTGRGRPR